MTLPLIYALQNASKNDRRRILYTIKKYNEKPEKVKEVIDFVRASGGLEYTEKVMHDFRAQAFELLYEFPLSPSRQALEELIIFVTDRKK